jgi:hypothetical protein
MPAVNVCARESVAHKETGAPESAASLELLDEHALANKSVSGINDHDRTSFIMNLWGCSATS